MTGPKILVPIGSPFSSVITTALLSNLTWLPSFLWIEYFVLTTTAFWTVPFLIFALTLDKQNIGESFQSFENFDNSNSSDSSNNEKCHITFMDDINIEDNPVGKAYDGKDTNVAGKEHIKEYVSV